MTGVVRTVLPKRALPAGSFTGLPSDAREPFTPSVTPDSSMQDVPNAIVTDPTTELRPTSGIRPVDVTSFSAPNRLRLGVMDTLLEWWRFRTRMSGDIFVGPGMQLAQNNVQPGRQFRAPHVLTKVVPNRRSFYSAPEYGRPDNSDAVASGIRRRCGRRSF